MRSRAYVALVGIAVLFFSILWSQPLSAQSFSFSPSGFTTSNVCANSSTPPPACQVLTNGSPSRPQVTSAGSLRLTTANMNQHGSAWFVTQQPLATGFTTAFQFQISNTNSCFFCSFPADGLALVIQADPSGTGALGYTGNGQNIAYGNNDISTASGPGAAILNSLAVELDTHQNSDYSDPDGNHIAVQSCGPNNSSTLTPNSADHNYMCPNGALAKIALQSLPAGMSLTDGLTHTITVNYLPPGTCTSGCNNLSVYLDSTLILQATLDITKQLNLTSGSTAYVGFTAATGSLVQNNDIISWSFSQWPLSPITITQPVQPTTPTNFNYTSSLSAVTDYSQSGLPPSSFQGLFMQGTATTITDQQFSDLVNNTPFQGSSCQHQDTGNGTYACVTTTDLCTTSTNSTAQGSNCLSTGTNPLINVSNTYNLDPAQKPLIAPGYIMGKDNALSCGASADNTCKGLVSIFTGVSGDALTSGGKTNNFNSVLIPIFGLAQPSTSVTTTPALNGGWINGPVTLNFNSVDIVPSNNKNPPASLPAISSINWQASGPNAPSPSSGTINGATGQVSIPGAVEGQTVITYAATDSSNTIETLITNSGNNVSSATPSLTINVDLTPPTVTCTPPAPVWQATDVSVPCTASDNANGSGLAGSSSFSVQTNVPANTETNSATIPAVTVKDVAGNTSAAQGPFGPFEVDKLAPSIMAPSISPASPVYGQQVSASYSCADGGSGVVLCGPTGTAQIPPTANTGTITMNVDSSIGTHTFTVNAQDLVGNISTPGAVTYTVGKATPVITWANPAPITYGTALSAVQLNASANVTGTFVYTPVAGTVLSVGTQTLTTTFTPSDTTDYIGVSKNVSLSVTQAPSSTTITSTSPNPALPGSPVLVTYSVGGVAGGAVPTGTVTVKASTGESCSQSVAAGSCSLTFNTTGTRTVTASYSGDTNYLASSTTTSVQVNVGDFSISATPATETISSGHQAIYTITVMPIAGLTGSVNLSCSGAPANASCSVSPSVDNLQGSPVTSTVTLNSNKNVNHGTFTLTFTGTYANGTLAHSTSVILTVKGNN
ncbi:MAG TPA: Ig-like domain repeat protein [Candidatus Sulfotelmatobacter sp.]|nr:Ig-like domain repeat protein [Candidatus Sulfotelmatobacter sp.]